MHFSLRSPNLPADYARMAEMINAVAHQPVTPASLAENDHLLPDGSVLHYVVAESDTGRVIGFARTHRYPNTRPGKYYVSVVTDKAVRRNGVGSALADAIERFALEHGATRLAGEVEDDDPASLAFVKRRGYEVVRLSYIATLDLTTFDDSRFAGVVEAVQSGGIRFFTLADEPGEAMERKLYEYLSRTFPDIPGYDGAQFMSFETFRKWMIDNPDARLDGIILAADGDRIVGATNVTVSPDGLYTPHTSVDREYRGRKIALALKLLSVKVARRYGATQMRTSNDSRNAPMLAVNRKLGYVANSGTYEVVREI